MNLFLFITGVIKGFQYICVVRLHFNCTFISNHYNKITFPAHSDWFFQSQTLKTIYLEHIFIKAFTKRHINHVLGVKVR